MVDKMKKIKVIITIVLVLLCFYGINKYMLRPYSNQKYQWYFEHGKEVDVVFVGSSHIMNGVFPQLIWDEYGISSYNWGNPLFGVKMSYWAFRLSLTQNKPKVAVLDVFGAAREATEPDSVALYHSGLDCFPISYEKILAVRDITKDKRQQLELILPLSIYHSRWEQELLREKYTDEEYLFSQLGASFHYGLGEIEKQQKIDENDILDFNNPTEGMAYIYKFIDLCRENNIEPILTCIPFEMEPYRQREYYTGKAIAVEAGVPFIDIVGDQVVDLEIDSVDKNDHMNTSGAKKISHALGEYLSQNCNLVDHRTEEKYASWNENYQKYRELVVLPNMLLQGDFEVLLTMLNDNKVSTYIKVAPKIQLNNLQEKLIQQIPNLLAVEYENEHEQWENYDIRIYVYDSNTGEELMIRDFYQNSYISNYRLIE